MAIEIRIVIDPFAFRGPAQRELTRQAIKGDILKRLAIQRERDERHRQRLIELGRIPPPNAADKD
jgi:hypothetical protein